MNVLILSTHLNPGGITSYLFTLSKVLVRKGHGVFIATSGGALVDNFEKNGVRHLQINIRTKSELDPRLYGCLPMLAKFIRENKIDLIHAHTRITQVMGVCLKKTTGCPYVSTCHGFYKTRWVRRFFPCWGDAVIAISQAVGEHLHNDFKVDQSKIHCVHNGINVEKFSLRDEATKLEKRKEFGIGNEPVIGIIARLADVKGHDVLIRAMAKIIQSFPTSKLFIVGEGREEDRLKNLTGQLRLKESIRFVPTVNQTASILPLFDIFALPSLEEGFGISAIEAQAVGLPVVASRVGGLPELIQDGQTGILVPPKDVHALAGAIIHLLQNKEYAKDMGLKARKFIEENFSMERMVKETIDVYQTVLAQRNE